MAKPFDVTTKNLVEAHPADWIKCLGLPPGPIDMIDAETSTVTAEADRVLRVAAATPYLAHIEFQASLDPTMAARLLRYNALLWYRHGLPVQSVVVLLRRTADSPDLDGQLSVSDAQGIPYLTFRYQILRVWQEPPETFLDAGPGTLALAPLADVPRARLPGIIDAMQSRVASEMPPAEVATFWASTFILLGLKFDDAFASQLLRGVRQMTESTTYQAILREGREAGQLDEARRVILRQGTKRFGTPDAATTADLSKLLLPELEILTDKVLDAENWAELLAE